MSSDAAEEANGTTVQHHLLVWTLANTSSLGDAGSEPDHHADHADRGAVRRAAEVGPARFGTQSGDFPQGQCLNIPACAPRFSSVSPDPFTEVISQLDSNDSRMQQVVVRQRQAVGCARHGGHRRRREPGRDRVVHRRPGRSQAREAPATSRWQNNNLTYPAIATTAGRRGVMAFTLVGEDHFASAAYASIDANAGVGDDPHRGCRPRVSTTASPATRRRSATRPGPAGVTTARPRSTATTSGSPASTSARPAR